VSPSWRHLAGKSRPSGGNRAAPDQVIALAVEGDAEPPCHPQLQVERLTGTAARIDEPAPAGPAGGACSLDAAEHPELALAVGFQLKAAAPARPAGQRANP